MYCVLTGEPEVISARWVSTDALGGCLTIVLSPKPQMLSLCISGYSSAHTGHDGLEFFPVARDNKVGC